MSRPSPVEFKLSTWRLTYREDSSRPYDVTILWEAQLSRLENRRASEALGEREDKSFGRLDDALAWVKKQTEGAEDA